MNRTRIMVADSDQTFLYLLKQTIDLEDDFELVHASSSGEDVLRCLRRTHIDVLVMDLLLEEVDGLEVLKQVTAWDIRPKVLVLSSVPCSKTVNQSMGLGCDYYMIKPLNLNSLPAKIRMLTRQTFGKPAPVRSQRLEAQIPSIIYKFGIPTHIKGF